MSEPGFGGVELGGTELVCAVGTGPEAVRAHTCLPTARPDETIAACLRFFAARGPVAAVGVASFFGPIDL